MLRGQKKQAGHVLGQTSHESANAGLQDLKCFLDVFVSEDTSMTLQSEPKLEPNRVQNRNQHLEPITCPGTHLTESRTDFPRLFTDRTKTSGFRFRGDSKKQ